MAARTSVATAAANGDLREVENLVRNGADVNARSRDGMTPLGIAAFWGYAEITEQLLQCGYGVHDLMATTHQHITLANYRADVNLANKGTLWTPLHSAAFQGHGKVIMKIMEHKPDVTLTDNQGRTAVDFASAMDGIWPFFAACGCKRTPKSRLIQMDIVRKVAREDPTIPKSEYAHFSRPGSAYIIKPQQMQYTDSNMALASQTGDVLAGTPEESDSRSRQQIPTFNRLWNN